MMPLYRIVTCSRNVFPCNRANPVTIFTPQWQSRYFSSIAPKASKTGLKKEKEKLKSYLTQRYMEYLQNYTKVLENRFPAAMRMYRVFSVGIKDFYTDMKKYISLQIKVKRDKGFTNFTRQELELYLKMPSDMWRIAPVLILSAIPFGNYIIFPLAFLKPRALLSSHFWSIQQRVEFTTQELKERLGHNKPAFRALQAKLDSIPDENSNKDKWGQVVGLLGSGLHPATTDILECKSLFSNGPYQLSNLSYSHCGHLLKLHGLKKNVFRRNKLKYRAFLLLAMDKAIIKEGGAESLTTETLRYACHIRGLNGSHLSNQEMITWLQQWLQVSQTVDKNSYSLLLHCPIFFGYNHPQNWMLIY